MARWVRRAALLLLLLLLLVGASLCDDPPPQFTSPTEINNVVQDPRTGRIYLGSVNALHQLNASLVRESGADTGPAKDNPQCTPPINAQCSETTMRDNVNKLLVVHPAGGSLVVCGSLFRGICWLANLSRVEDKIYYSDNKGERTYVASTDESVSVVGVISTFVKDEVLSVLLVGKGYGQFDSSKLVSTRLLKDVGDMVVFENLVEAATVQASPFVQRHNHDFRHAFRSGGHVYFLFSRVPGSSESRKQSFVARLCEDDHNYYSYTEQQLNCSADNRYNQAQAAHVAVPGAALAQSLGLARPDEPVLFVTFSSVNSVNSVGEPSRSALCVYPLSAIDRRLGEVIEACYSGDGLIDNKQAVYLPYMMESKCIHKKPASNMTKNFPCGAEFLSSPLASMPEFALTSDPVYVRNSSLTAVAVAVENEHTIAFLGTSTGEVVKVHLSSNNDTAYSRVPGDGSDSPVNKNLFFDSSLDNLYITTARKITKVRVQACHLKKDCQACVAQKDPYCGWCVLEGRCTRKKDCATADKSSGWLWSPDLKCVTIQSFDPPNISRHKNQQVEIRFSSIPSIEGSGRLQCLFDGVEHDAVMRDLRVTCALPDPSEIPDTPENQDYVAMTVSIVVDGRVEVATSKFKFYNCAAVVKRAENTPCIACVSSEWGCQWNTQEHTCSDRDESIEGANIIKPQQEASCPKFENAEPQLIPVGFKTPISFMGANLDVYQGRKFRIGTKLMKHTEEEVTLEDGSKFNFKGYEFSYDEQQEVNVTFHVKDSEAEKKIDSTLKVVLYNCSVGREDCSLCKNADEKYDCVWCAATQACVYRKLCAQELSQCPPPKITEIIPRYGPMNGQIAVTIRGSNLGIKKEDIRMITVAGVPCVHLEDRYSVSTSVVCEIGPVNPGGAPSPPRTEGPVLVEVEGGRNGTSAFSFTYRDPVPEQVHPTRGPVAGGTFITITGTHLDTATKDDISITVGDVPCEVLTFGTEITCETGAYTGPKGPSGQLTVTMKYGGNTSRDVAFSHFEYSDNPKVSSHSPTSSFECGGRRIVVTGWGFDLVQRATMRVKLSADEFSQTASAEFVQQALSKNDSVLEFLSPVVNRSDESQSFEVNIHLDNVQQRLVPFEYHSDPVFNNLNNKVISEDSIISVTGRGFSKAMTAVEAQAFVGNELCTVTILQDDKLFLVAPSTPPKARSRRQRRDTSSEPLELLIKFGNGEWKVGSVQYEGKYEIPLYIIIPAVILPMLLFIGLFVYCYRRKSQQAEREYEKVKHQLENLEESVRDRCKKEFTDLMIEMEDHTSDLSEARIPLLDYKTYTDRVFFLPSKDGANDVMITGKLDIPEWRRTTVDTALNQFSNLLNSKTFLINFIRTLEGRQEFNARARVYFASLLTVALHGKLEYYTDIMRTLLLELMEEYVHSKNPKLMLRR